MESDMQPNPAIIGTAGTNIAKKAIMVMKSLALPSASMR
jgi:hypothetical protein